MLAYEDLQKHTTPLLTLRDMSLFCGYRNPQKDSCNRNYAVFGAGRRMVPSACMIARHGVGLFFQGFRFEGLTGQCSIGVTVIG